MLLRLAEAETAQDPRCPRWSRMRIDVGEPRLDVGDGMGIGRRRCGGKKCVAFLVRRQDDIEQRLFPAGSLLRHAPDARPPRHRYRTALGRKFARHELEQRRFARAIAPDKPHLVPLRNGSRRPFEDEPALHAVCQFIHMKHGRAA